MIHLKAKAAAELTEMRVDEQRRILIRADTCMRTWSNVATALRARLLAIPPKLAPVLASTKTPAEAQDLSRRAIHEALDELSRLTVDTEGTIHESKVTAPMAAISLLSAVWLLCTWILWRR